MMKASKAAVFALSLVVGGLVSAGASECGSCDSCLWSNGFCKQEEESWCTQWPENTWCGRGAAAPTPTTPTTTMPTTTASKTTTTGTAPGNGVWPQSCRSRSEKLWFATRLATHCGAALGKTWDCLTNLTSWHLEDFEKCANVLMNHPECQDTYAEACGETEPKCCRCMTTKPMPSNQNHGCLLDIFKGDSCDSTCALL